MNIVIYRDSDVIQLKIVQIFKQTDKNASIIQFQIITNNRQRNNPQTKIASVAYNPFLLKSK